MKKILMSLTICYVCVCVSRSLLAATPSYISQYKQITAGEPTYKEILLASLKKSRLSVDSVAGLLKKAKYAPLLPTLYVGYDHALGERETQSVNDNVSIASGIVTMGPDENDYSYYENVGRTLRLRAVWQLSDLVYSNSFLQVEQAKRSTVKQETQLAEDLYKIFETRELCLMQYLEKKGGASSKAGLLYAKFQSLTDRLDAMTGGVFNKKWWKEKGGK